MKKATWKKTSFAEKIVEIIRTSPSINEMREQLQDYHDNDIAQSLQFLNRAERNLLYSALDAEWLAEIISYLDDPAEYIDEIGIDKLAEILNEMDADDAVDLWENIDESVKVKLRPMIDDETKSAILLINSYDDSDLRLDDVEIVLAPAGVNVGIAGVLFLLPFVMGFQRSCRIALVFFKSQNCVLCHETPFPIPFLSGTFPQENPAENISDRIGMDKI